MIREGRIIPQNAMLNGRIEMDATNYYFQTGNMHSMKELYTRDVNEKRDGRALLRLKRTCPNCGKMLVLRQGRKWFLGYEGFVSMPRCEYKETLNHRRLKKYRKMKVLFICHGRSVVQ